MHADDVAHWIICAIEHGAAAVTEVFNTVSPQALTLRGYAEAMYRWFEREPNLTFAPFEQWRLTVDKSDAESTYTTCTATSTSCVVTGIARSFPAASIGICRASEAC